MAGPIETYRGVAYPWLCDSMGHMNTQFYCTLYDGASFHFLSMIAPYGEHAPRQCGWADVKQTIEYKEEVRAGTLLVISSRLLRIGSSSIGYRHEMRNAETGTLHSTSEHVTVLFDLKARKSTPLDAAARSRAEAMLKAHGN
jgi:acyl-CoA thioester hydrolase